jgi:hypothetical protein
MKLTTVLPDVFGSLADDVERNERSWKDVWEDILLFQMFQPFKYHELYVMACSGLILMLQSPLNFLASTRKASRTYKALCSSGAFVWIVSIEPLPTL